MVFPWDLKATSTALPSRDVNTTTLTKVATLDLTLELTLEPTLDPTLDSTLDSTLTVGDTTECLPTDNLALAILLALHVTTTCAARMSTTAKLQVWN